MNKINCLLIDDEPLALRVLRKYCAQLPALEEKGAFTNPLEALEVLSNENIDLIFLDINMPEISGLSLIKSLPNPPAFVFTTAYPEYAVEGFELEAVDYLLKPFSFERFLKAVQKARKTWAQEEETATSMLLVRADKRWYNLPHEKINYLEAYGDYVKIHTEEKTIVPKKRLSELEAQLPERFFMRVHRSFIVRVDKIEYIEGNHIKINNDTIPLALNYKNILLDRLS